MTELAIIENLTPAAIFTEKKVEDFLSRLEEEVLNIPLDISTPAGREYVKSLAYKIARTKTTLDDAGKDMTDEWRQQTNVVNEERRKIRERLDSLKEKVRKPLTEYEERAKARIAELEGKLNDIISTKENLSEATSEQIQDRIANVNATHGQTVWDEYYQRATYEMQEAIKALELGLEAAKKREADAAELEKLRKDQAEREQRERDERIAKEAEDRARQEAERKANEEKEAAAREAKEREDKLQREKDEAEQRVKDAEAAAAKAAEDERQRIANEAAAKEAEDKKRRENEAHRNKVIAKAALSIGEVAPSLEAEAAQYIATAIADGKIANVKMEF